MNQINYTAKQEFKKQSVWQKYFPAFFSCYKLISNKILPTSNLPTSLVPKNDITAFNRLNSSENLRTIEKMKLIGFLRQKLKKSDELNQNLLESQLKILGDRFENFCMSNKHIKPSIEPNMLREMLLQKINLDPIFAQDLLDPTKKIFLDFQNIVENNQKITVTLLF